MESLCPHQSLGLWPRGGNSPNRDAECFWEEESEIEPMLPFNAIVILLQNIIFDICHFLPNIPKTPEHDSEHRCTRDIHIH